MAKTSNGYLPTAGFADSAPAAFATQSLASKKLAFFLGLLNLFSAVGCQPQGTAQVQPSSEARPKETTATHSEVRDKSRADSGRAGTAKSQPKADAVAPARLPPAVESQDIPAPGAICGHAVAFAGWQPGVAASGPRLFFFDPGDNAIEVGTHTHRWKADPGESTVQLGKRRPAIVLFSAKPFTVVGAVVLTAKADALAKEKIELPASHMPDLSQSIHDSWPGLCGPTSAADVLYGIASRRPAILDGFERGPSPQGNRDACRLIAGEDGRLSAESLASQMNLADNGKGVTNEGMRVGLEAWLSRRDPGNWDVGLDWLDDSNKEPAALVDFFQRLAVASRNGGGAVLCLWPGTEFSDRSTDEVAAERVPERESSSAREESHADGSGSGKNRGPVESRGGDSEDRDSGVPSESGSTARATQSSPRQDAQSDDSESVPTHPSDVANDDQSPRPGGTKGFDGRKTTPQAAAAALARGQKSIERARRASEDGNNRDAIEAIAIAISTLRPHASSSKECQAALKEAIRLADEIEAHTPRQGKISNKPTRFQ